MTERSGDGNPYEALDLDPRLDLETLTELLRERAEGMGPDERRRVQALWHELAVHEAARARHAMLARRRTDPPPTLAKATLAGSAAAEAPMDMAAAAADLLRRLRPEDLLVPPWLEPVAASRGAGSTDALAGDPFVRGEVRVEGSRGPQRDEEKR